MEISPEVRDWRELMTPAELRRYDQANKITNPLEPVRFMRKHTSKEPVEPACNETPTEQESSDGFDESAQEFRIKLKDGRELIPAGFQEIKLRHPAKAMPDWMRDEPTMMLHIAGRRVMRKVRICLLYFKTGMTAPEVAASMHLKLRTVENTIYELCHRQPYKAKRLRHLQKHVPEKTVSPDHI